jgi:excisionase family DNA binding protein
MNANTPPMESPDAMLKIDAVAAMLNVSTRTVRRLAVRGVLLPAPMAPRSLRFRRSRVQAYIDFMERKAQEAHA